MFDGRHDTFSLWSDTVGASFGASLLGPPFAKIPATLGSTPRTPLIKRVSGIDLLTGPLQADPKSGRHHSCLTPLFHQASPVRLPPGLGNQISYQSRVATRGSG
jgi:hypothetical protein